MKPSSAQRTFPWVRLHSLELPVRLDALAYVLEEIRAVHGNVHDVDATPALHQLVGGSDQTQHVRRMIEKVAPTMATVLITGESGTGKEIVARQIHALSGRDGPFIAINCGAIPEHLLESELFGHQRGAFTGAVNTRPGRFEQAKGGTFFLDEIGDMPPVMQVKLLRVLEERCVVRVGGDQSIPIDIRLIAATHRDLPARIEAGSFREDLYYRLNVFPIEIAPLRDRRSDIDSLVDEFVHRQRQTDEAPLRITDGALGILEDYEWPGNVRELGNVIERLMVTCPNGMVTADDLPAPLVEAEEENAEVIEFKREMSPVKLPPQGVDLKRFLADIEREMITRALRDANGVVMQAAECLGVGRTTLVEKIRRYNIPKVPPPLSG